MLLLLLLLLLLPPPLGSDKFATRLKPSELMKLEPTDGHPPSGRMNEKSAAPPRSLRQAWNGANLTLAGERLKDYSGQTNTRTICH